MTDHQTIWLRRKSGQVIGSALVDADDYEWINQHRWSILKSKYAYRGEWNAGSPRLILLHRAIMGLETGDPRTVDHINRNTLDNRRSNLRIIPHGGQSQNRGTNRETSSEYRGVYWHKGHRRWVAKVAGVWVGSFKSEVEAAEAARARRLETMEFATG